MLLDEYLEEPLETFSGTERVDSIERTIGFDILAYTGRFASSSVFCEQLWPRHRPWKKYFPSRDGRPACTNEFSAPCERLFSSEKETYTARRNRIQLKLMEAPQALKLCSRSKFLTEELLLSWISELTHQPQ